MYMLRKYTKEFDNAHAALREREYEIRKGNYPLLTKVRAVRAVMGNNDRKTHKPVKFVLTVATANPII